MEERFGALIYASDKITVFRSEEDDMGARLYKTYPGMMQQADAEFRLTHEYNITRYLLEDQVTLEKHEGKSVLSRPFIEGVSLMEHLKKDGLPIDELLAGALSLVGDLRRLQSKGVLHLDLNPANIIVDNQGKYHLIDFDSSVQVGPNLKILGNELGIRVSPAYMSPEQTGRINRPIDQRTDLYGLGATLYHMATGRRVFPLEDQLELVHAHIARKTESPKNLREELPVALSDIILKLLSKDGANRYGSAMGVEADLKRCQELVAQGELDDSFALGVVDFSDQFIISQKLYGRDDHLKKLRQAWEETTVGQVDLAVVAGEAGTGRSQLVEAFLKDLGGEVQALTGKVTDSGEATAYAILDQAFGKMVDRLLSGNPQLMVRRKESLMRTLGQNARVLTDLFPSMAKWLGPQSEVEDLQGQEALNRLEYTLLGFLGWLTDGERPTIFVLENAHLCGKASQGLIRQILAMTSKNKVLVMLTVSEDHGDMDWGEEPIQHIVLDNWSKLEMQAMLADTLRTDRTYVEGLANALMAKSLGNPLLTEQVLQLLFEERLISPDRERMRWTWDEKAIAAYDVSDHVAELLVRQLKKLPQTSTAVLKLAACIGTEFDNVLLGKVYQAEGLDNSLDSLRREGIISLVDVRLVKQENDETIVEQQYQFAHARLRETVLGWLQPEERRGHELAIGLSLLAYSDARLTGATLYSMLGFLNAEPSEVTDTATRGQLVKYNLRAAEEERSTLNYEPAHTYAMAGLAFATPADPLRYRLTFLAAQTDYLRGDYDTMETWQEELLPLISSPVERLQVFMLKIDALFSQAMHHEVLQYVADLLGDYGIKVKPQPKQLDIILALIPLKGSFGKYNLRESQERGFMDDPEERVLTQIVTRAMESAFFVDRDMYALLVAKMTARIMKKGLTEQGTVVLASYGIIAVSAFSDFKVAQSLGEAVEVWVEQVSSQRNRALLYFVYNFFFAHWYKPMRETFPQLERGLKEAVASGDPQYISYSLNNLFTNRYMSGSNWMEIRDLVLEHKELALATQAKTGNYFSVISGSQVLEMTNPTASDEPWRLVGGLITEADEPILKNHSNNTTLFGYSFVRFSLAVRVGNWPKAAELARIGMEYMEYSKGSSPWKTHFLYMAAALLRGDGGKEALKFAKKAENQLKKWYKSFPEMRGWYHAVVALRLEAQGKVDSAETAFGEAVAECYKENSPYITAMVVEWSAEFHKSQGNALQHRALLTEAYYLYQEAGLSAKLYRLRQDFPWLERRMTTAAHSHDSVSQTLAMSSKGVAASLDMQSLLRTTEAIASEIAIDRFLERLMDIIIENAGATRGVLVLDRKGSLVVSSEKDVNDSVAALGATLLKEYENLARSVVQWVLNTNEVALIDDAKETERFKDDDYLRESEVQSVICLPILRQGERSGLIYLENNLTTGAFTRQRVDFLQLLLGQIAISLENAILYEGLEEKVRERTREITNQKEIIEKTNQSITDSINYAQRIQQALLPARNLLTEHFAESFVLLMPRDIVSGDFYWMSHQQNKAGESITFLAAVDCTGHGVPGAFMSILGISFLDQLVENGIHMPADILTALEDKIQYTLRREDGPSSSHDGMDMALVAYNHTQKELIYSGAVNPILYFQDGNEYTIKGRRPGIGGGLAEKPFENHVIPITSPTQVYLYSDGFQDQFGGPDGRKFMSKRLRGTLASIYEKPFAEQQQTLANILSEWSGNLKQIDDILIMGVRIDP